MWEYFQAGGPLMWALLACSIVALAVILERCCFWARLSLKRDEAIAARVLQDASEGKPWQGGAPKGIITAMLRAGLPSGKRTAARPWKLSPWNRWPECARA